MLNSDFEKKVRQQMEELTLKPGESLWDEIERRLPPEKKRRPWLLYMLLFVLLFGTALLLWNTNIKDDKNMVATETADMKLPATISKTSGRNSPDGQDKNAWGKTGTETTNIDNIKLSDSIGSAQSVASGEMPDHDKRAGVTDNPTRSARIFNETNPGKPRLTVFTPSTQYRADRQTLPSASFDSKKIASKPRSASQLQRLTALLILQKPAVPAQEFPDSIFLSEGSIPVPYVTQLHRPTSDATSLTQGLPSSLKGQNKWQFSIVGGGGVSGLVTGLFNGKNVLADNIGNSSGVVNSPGTGSSLVLPPNEPTSSAAFMFGLQVERPLHHRWKLITGLNYQYFSSNVRTGSMVDSSASFSGGNNSITSNGFYLAGDGERYKNKVQLLHMPVLVQYVVIKKMPLYLEAGPGFSYVMNNNVLLYNSGRRVYFSSRDAYNQWLLSFAAGAGVQLNRQKQQPLKLGYRFNYGISSVTRAAFGKQKLQSSMFYLAVPIK